MLTSARNPARNLSRNHDAPWKTQGAQREVVRVFDPSQLRGPCAARSNGSSGIAPYASVLSGIARLMRPGTSETARAEALFAVCKHPFAGRRRHVQLVPQQVQRVRDHVRLGGRQVRGIRRHVPGAGRRFERSVVTAGRAIRAARPANQHADASSASAPASNVPTAETKQLACTFNVASAASKQLARAFKPNAGGSKPHSDAFKQDADAANPSYPSTRRAFPAGKRSNAGSRRFG